MMACPTSGMACQALDDAQSRLATEIGHRWTAEDKLRLAKLRQTSLQAEVDIARTSQLQAHVDTLAAMADLRARCAAAAEYRALAHGVPPSDAASVADYVKHTALRCAAPDKCRS